jgi:hypothetical protein
MSNINIRVTFKDPDKETITIILLDGEMAGDALVRVCQDKDWTLDDVLSVTRYISDVYYQEE